MNPALSLDLLSWNVHGPPFAPRRRARFAAVAGEIERRAPELVLLQEVWFPGDAAWLVARFARDYDAIDCAPRRWPLRTGGLLGLLRRSSGWMLGRRGGRFERYRTAANLWRFWEGDGAAGKGVQVLPLSNRASGTGIVVLHTHVQAQYDTIRHEVPRAAQLRHLTEIAGALEAELPVVAAGDLNTGPSEWLYADLIAPAWHDLTTAVRAGRPDARTQFDCGAEPIWIDYVLARRSATWQVDVDLALIENAARDAPFSDHHGLHASISMRPI